MLKKNPPKSIKESEIIAARYTIPCKLGCKTNWEKRRTIRNDLTSLICVLEDLDLIKNNENYLMRQDRPGQLWSYDWKKESTIQEKKEEELETIRGFVQEFYNEDFLRCTCPENFKYIEIMKIKFADELPSIQTKK